MDSLADNRLVAGLPAIDRRRFIGDCEFVDLRFGQDLGRALSPMRHVYFPLTAIISQFSGTRPKAMLEVGLIGYEGMCGATAMLGPRLQPFGLLVQGEGSSLRMGTDGFLLKLLSMPALDRSLRRYLLSNVLQLGQATVCTRYHAVEPRLARWLLMMSDRARAPALRLTHKFLSDMLGVRREGVTEAAAALQERGLIHYSRGRIELLDRAGLERAACDCYAADIATYRRVMRVGRQDAI
jgi:hypothetical protein